ncbi:RING-H2 finger protein ATL20-like [Fagus crenata]
MSSIVDSRYLFRFTVFEEWQAVDQNNPLWLRGDFPIEFFLYSLTQFVGHQPSITEACDFTLWLPRHELLLQDNGSRLSSILSWMNVQITEQQAVLQNIASVALSAGTSSRLRIVVVLAHLTALLLDTTDSDSNTIMTDTFENSIIRESMEAFEARSIPATRSAVEALEKFRFQQQSDSVSLESVSSVWRSLRLVLNSFACHVHMSITDIVSSSGSTPITLVPCANTQCLQIIIDPNLLLFLYKD